MWKNDKTDNERAAGRGVFLFIPRRKDFLLYFFLYNLFKEG